MRAVAEGAAATVLLPRRARRPDFGVGAWAAVVARYRTGRGWEARGGWWGERPPARSPTAGVVEGGGGLKIWGCWG